MDRAERAVTQWQKERPDLDVTPMTLLGRLAEAATLVARTRQDPLFARFGLQPGEFDVLATLRRSGPPFALTPTALYEATMVTSGAMTSRIDRLEANGLVERTRHPTDRRGVIVKLTAKGEATIDRALEAHVENLHEIVAGLSKAERDQLSSLLAKLIATLG
jgi:DNA-binding MarR family transcriptional regulator